MNREDRKAALSAYREIKPQAGIYAIHAGGTVWVAAAPRLETVENRLGFTVQQGGHPNKAFQRAAAGGFRIEILEVLDPDTPDIARPRLLKERLAHWLDHTGGATL